MKEPVSVVAFPGASRPDASRRGSEEAFRHEALLYAGEADFVDRAASFIRDGLQRGEPVFVAVAREKVDLLRSELGRDAGMVRFADMYEVGRNPARIIPLWSDLVSEHARPGRSIRGIGEPIWATRSPEELVECQRHESLLNLAFAGARAWWLLCPYDTDALDPAVIDEALRSHPFVSDRGRHRASRVYRGLAAAAEPFDLPLPEPAARPDEVTFEGGRIDGIRDFVFAKATAFGITGVRRDDLVLAVNEVVANSLRHAGGRGTLRVWRSGETLICEVADDGRIDIPLVGRVRPSSHQESGFGLWLVHQLCDLVQIRSLSGGSVVRVHMLRG